MFLALAKELAESILRKFRVGLIKPSDGVSSILSNVRINGIHAIQNFLDKNECQKFIEKIDLFIASSSSNVWLDDTKADHRIYFINEVDEDFNAFYENPKIREVLKAYTGTANPLGMLLAAKIEYKEGNLGSGGGWHRDSPVTHQFKAVCYLNDVDEQNGPFQYIKGSHRKDNVIRNYFNKVFKPGQYRFTENEISNYLAKNNKKVDSITGNAGTLVYADTKGIHRGKPVEQGVRYVLFCYFWHDKIPKHFESLKQKI